MRSILSFSNRLEPSVRFTEFADDWHSLKFRDAFAERREKTIKENEDILISCAIDGLYLNSELFNHFRGKSNIGYLKIQKNDLILSTQNLHLGNANVNTRFDHGIISPAYKVFELCNVDPLFISAWVKRDETKRFFLSATTEGASQCRKNIEWELLNNQMILIPHIKEQRKIGELIKRIDDTIEKERTKLFDIKKYKRGLLQDMFPSNGETVPKIRFPGFSDAWKQRKLGEMVQFSKGAGYSKGDLKESGTPIILYGRLYTKYETVISDVDTFAEPKSGSVYSRGGEVIVPASGETAEDISIASVVEKQGILLGGDLNVIMPPEYIDSTFLAISISNGKPHEDMAKMAQGKSVVHLHNTDLEKIDLIYPSYNEQVQISTYFKCIDSLITHHQNKYNSLKKYKAGLLQHMFI